MTYRFHFDRTNKILLLQFEGRLTDQAVTELYWAVRKYSTDTDASTGIWDLSSAAEFAVSPEFICQLAKMEPAMPNPHTRHRFFVAPAGVGSAIPRMFEIAVEHTHPLLKIVRSVSEALAALGIQSPQFEPLK
jgi:hypothetical protein